MWCGDGVCVCDICFSETWVYVLYIGTVVVSAACGTHLFPYGNTISSIINQKRDSDGNETNERSYARI